MLLQLSAAELGRLIVARAGSTHLPLTEQLIQEHSRISGGTASPGDIASWNNSLPVVVKALLDCGLDEVEVQIEVNLPHTNSAVDLVLCGRHPGTDTDSYLAVELKQVRHATVDPLCPIAVDLGFGDGKNKLHPVRQVQRYCEYMLRYLPHLRQNEDQLMGVALLHNARDADVEALFGLSETDHGFLYTLDDLPRFRRVLTSRFAPASGKRAASALEQARQDPLLKVTDVARQRSVVGGGLTLLDEQYVAVDRITRHLEKTAHFTGFDVGLFCDAEAAHSPAPDPGAKRVYILRGGPGSGKSAVALELQRALGLKGREAVLASGSHAYTETLREIMLSTARGGRTADKRRAALKLYRYFNSFSKTPPDSIDVLICDEAHRMRRSSTYRWTPKELRDDDRPQATEVIRAAKVPIFLLDDHQSIRPDEVGTATYLKELASGMGCDVEVTDLEGTFRAGGSKRYQRWVQQLLGLDASDPVAWRPDGRMTLAVADSPEQMEQFIRERHFEGATARITAGFCWPWSNPDGDQLVDDVHISDWRRPWNVKPERSVPNAPRSDLWSTDRRGVDQIGCVYTAQTFEYDWNGVIIGPDLLFRDGKFKVDRSASCDPAFRGPIDDAIVTRCVLNAYHVLLTRGVVGTVVYAVDPATHNELRRLIPGAIGMQHYDGAQPKLTAEGSQLPPAYRRRHG
ncbi:DNA/RNA helicase domain-containing protein [Streptomyces sp. NPDC059466]|uniref:DNA/RNA helicase domain-containing protein n=1 Tax=Streptomyces sp. NPDC059466 TaxID=3346843 RepID=UPI0036C6C57F